MGPDSEISGRPQWPHSPPDKLFDFGQWCYLFLTCVWG